MERNRLRIQQTNRQHPVTSPVLYQPQIVGYMSVDESRNYHSDLSKLKFVTDIPKSRISLDLTHKQDEAVKRTTDDMVEKIDLLLKFLLDQRIRFNFPPSTFISYRRTLFYIMYNAWVVEPVPDWGYKFVQYLTSDRPNMSPNIDRPVVENDAFTLCYCSQIGDHKLFYAADVDGLLATGDTPPPPETTSVQENIDYLKRHQYVELTTYKEIEDSKRDRNLRKYKLAQFWCYCYLANLKGLLVGFRNDDGIVGRLQWFDTAEIPEYCKNEWNPQTALSFLDYFLSFVKSTMNSCSRGNTSVNEPVTREFYINGYKEIIITQDHELSILPDWYIKEALSE